MDMDQQRLPKPNQDGEVIEAFAGNMKIIQREGMVNAVELGVSIFTDIGGRDVNEDQVRCATIANWKRFGIQQSSLLCVLCDGHGGPQVSKFVADNIFDRVVSKLVSLEPDYIKTILQSVFIELQEEMKNTQLGMWPPKPDGSPCTAGTTVSLLMILGNSLIVANVGDSPVLVGWAQNGVVIQRGRITKDHKPDDMEERKHLESRGGVVAKVGSQMRVCRSVINPQTKLAEMRPFLSMTRALGNYWSYSPTSMNYIVSPIPDVTIANITEDIYIIMCSDGVTDVLTDVDITDMCVKQYDYELTMNRYLENSGEPCSQGIRSVSSRATCNVAAQIVSAAKTKYQEKGYRADNISAITIRCTKQLH